MQTSEIIERLRAAAHQREWNTLQPTLIELYTLIGQPAALEIVVERLRRYLPTFQYDHPDDAQPSGRIVRELLVGVVSFGFSPDRLPEHITNDYPTPGSGQFAHAVLELCRAMQRDRDPDERITLFASATANVILAELGHYWYRLHPEAYARVRANHIDPATGDYTDPEAARIPLAFWIDPEVAARDTAAWLELADLVEPRLSS